MTIRPSYHSLSGVSETAGCCVRFMPLLRTGRRLAHAGPRCRGWPQYQLPLALCQILPVSRHDPWPRNSYGIGRSPRTGVFRSGRGDSS